MNKPEVETKISNLIWEPLKIELPLLKTWPEYEISTNSIFSSKTTPTPVPIKSAHLTGYKLGNYSFNTLTINK